MGQRKIAQDIARHISHNSQFCIIAPTICDHNILIVLLPSGCHTTYIYIYITLIHNTIVVVVSIAFAATCGSIFGHSGSIPGRFVLSWKEKDCCIRSHFGSSFSEMYEDLFPDFNARSDEHDVLVGGDHQDE